MRKILTLSSFIGFTLAFSSVAVDAASPLSYEMAYRASSRSNTASSLSIKSQFSEGLSVQDYLNTLQSSQSLPSVSVEKSNVKLIANRVDAGPQNTFVWTSQYQFGSGFLKITSETVTTCRIGNDRPEVLELDCRSEIHGGPKSVNWARFKQSCAVERGLIRSCESLSELSAIGGFFRSKAEIERDLLISNGEVEILMRLLALTKSPGESKELYREKYRAGIDGTYTAIQENLARNRQDFVTAPVSVP